MKIVNGNGAESLTQSSQAKENAKKELADLRKTPPKSIADLTKRIEKIEEYLGISAK